MKHFRTLAVFAALLCGVAAHAAPPCWPRQLGSTGSDFKRGTTADGNWVAWTCTARGVTATYGAWAVHDYVVQHPDVTGLTPTRAARAYWDANVNTAPDARIDRLKAAARAAFE